MDLPFTNSSPKNTDARLGIIMLTPSEPLPQKVLVGKLST